jgi:tripartite-type tricarboxylate transporter receptor subunit TctC
MLLVKSAVILSTAAIIVAVQPAQAQNYPTRAVEFIVPFAPGGGADASQRAFNTFAEPLVGKPLPINNKPGAGGATGWSELVRAKPDGYTLSVTTPPNSIVPALVKPKQTGYKLSDFTDICIYAVVPDVLVVKEGGQFNTLKDFVEFAKAHPKKVKTANMGTLGADYMTTLMIEDMTGVQTTQIPFNSGALAMQGTLAGTTDAFVASALYAVAQKGNLRALAIATEARHPLAPEVPTFKELGYNVVSERYRVLSGPPGMSAELISYWSDICKKVTDNPKFREEMDKLGQPVVYKDVAETKRLVGNLTKDLQDLVAKYKLAE